ncbi:MAG: FCD domain-containing protein [Pseudoxanthomonas sp.]
MDGTRQTDATRKLGRTPARKPPKIAEVVASQLRGRIVRGELQPGEALPGEAAMMLHYGVSRQTLREALRVLESESLLSISRGVNGGPRVLESSTDMVTRQFGLVLQRQGTTLDDVFEARLVIEPEAVRLLTQHAYQHAPATLRECITAQETVIDDDEALAHATVRFHESLVELSGNQTLSLMLKTINGVFEKHISTVSLLAAGKVDTTKNKRLGLRAQSRLADLIESGDAEQAAAYWHTHLQAIGKILLRTHGPTRVVDVLES